MIPCRAHAEMMKCTTLTRGCHLSRKNQKQKKYQKIPMKILFSVQGPNCQTIFIGPYKGLWLREIWDMFQKLVKSRPRQSVIVQIFLVDTIQTAESRCQTRLSLCFQRVCLFQDFNSGLGLSGSLKRSVNSVAFKYKAQACFRLSTLGQMRIQLIAYSLKTFSTAGNTACENKIETGIYSITNLLVYYIPVYTVYTG